MIDGITKVFTQAQSETLDYTFDFATNSWLASAETINSASVVSTPSGLNVTSVSFTNSFVICFLSSGTPDNSYAVTALVTTSAGRKPSLSFQLDISEFRSA